MRWEGWYRTFSALIIGAAFTGTIKLFYQGWRDRERKPK